MNLADLADRVEALTQDRSGATTDADREDAVRAALRAYDRDAPRVVVEDIAGDGTTYDLAFAADTAYVNGFSQIASVEYPAGQRPPAVLSRESWSIYRTPSTWSLRLHGLTPGATETVRVTYTAPHTLAGLDPDPVVDGVTVPTPTTVPAWHEEALAALAASRLLEQLAARFVHEQEPQIAADVVDRQSKSDLAARRARELASYYRTAVLGTGQTDAPAGAVVAWHGHTSAGQEWLTHPRSAWRVR